MNLFPNIHPNMPIANADGTIHPVFMGILSQLMTSLQKNLSNEGYNIPELTNDQYAQLNPANSPNALLVNNGQLLINLNGTFKTITTS